MKNILLIFFFICWYSTVNAQIIPVFPNNDIPTHTPIVLNGRTYLILQQSDKNAFVYNSNNTRHKYDLGLPNMKYHPTQYEWDTYKAPTSIFSPQRLAILKDEAWIMFLYINTQTRKVDEVAFGMPLDTKITAEELTAWEDYIKNRIFSVAFFDDFTFSHVTIDDIVKW
ncbi:MAG: hypothetical protein EAZ44_06610 [Cytophagia bacterium]|nr:MAG: hypothetical protein EAZ44_06610 [Cytophagia bacterium]TAG42089.1 MAG: hypothetical protein EAZ31_06845 [Cytophagia bacterium]